MTINRIQNLANRQFGMVRKMVNKVPKLRRGMVWCHRCGNSQKVDSAECVKSGWPKCCEATMSIDSPEERAKGDVSVLSDQLPDPSELKGITGIYTIKDGKVRSIK